MNYFGLGANSKLVSELKQGKDSSNDSILAYMYFDILFKNYRLIIGLCVVLLIACGFGLTNLGLTTDNRVFFGANNPQLTAFEQFEKIYTESNNVIIAFSPKSGKIFDANTLSAIEEFTARAWKLPYSIRVDSLSNFQYSYAVNDELIIKDLYTNSHELSEKQIDNIRDIALNDKLIVNRLISSDSSVAATIVNFIPPNRTDDQSINKITNSLRLLQKEFQTKYPGLTIYLSGDIILGAAIGEATLDDVSSLIPAMFILILFVIGLIQRSFTALLSTFLIIIFTIVTAMGIVGWLGYILNPGSAIAPTIIITICATYCVHIINSVFNDIKKDVNKKHVIAYAIKNNFYPVFLTSITTIIGFLSMLFSDSPPFHDLGILVSIGVFVTFCYVFSILPLLLSVLPINPKNKQVKPFTDNSIIKLIINMVENRNKSILIGLIVLFSISIFGVSKINLVDDWVKYFDQRYTFRNDSDFIIKNLSGIESLEFSLDSGSENGISSPQYLKLVDDFTTWLRNQEGVSYVYSISDIIKRINKNMHNDDPAFYKIPLNAELAAQYLLVYEMSLPYGLDLGDRMDIQKSKLRISAVGDLDTGELRKLEQSAQLWLEEHAPSSITSTATGMSLIFAHISERNIHTMLSATLLALLLVSIILVLALKSVKLGLISLIPNIIPAAVAVGLWGWFYGQLGMAIAVVGAMTLGIIVDDTIHFLSRFRKAMNSNNNDPVVSIRYAFDTVGGALFTTTCALVAGFGILAFSGFQVNWAMGLLAAMTIAIALLTDFVLLPLILAVAYKKKTITTSNI